VRGDVSFGRPERRSEDNTVNEYSEGFHYVRSKCGLCWTGASLVFILRGPAHVLCNQRKVT
jgi:hypothetical protein